MSQFDVYLNPSKKSREAFPYVVDIQSALINDINTRLVIPLGKFQNFSNERMHGLTPIITYENEEYILLTPQLTSIPLNLLKNPVGSIESMSNEIIAAIDLAITGI